MGDTKTDMYWLFPMRQRDMPFAPARLNFLHPWVLPSDAIDSAEQQEAASRIILPSVWHGAWVGVELHAFCQLLAGEAKICQPNRFEKEISLLNDGLTDGFSLLRAAYELSQQKLVYIGGPRTAFVLYPTPQLAELSIRTKVA